jgi:hypothetical protein
MSRPFRFPSHRLRELVESKKCLRETEIKWKAEGKGGRSIKLPLDLVDGPFVDFVLSVAAGDLKDPTTYRAALILAGERVRGVDFNETARSRFYRPYIVRGWHQNVIDPNLPSSDRNQNRHIPLEDFDAIDLDDFFRKLCQLWHIDLEFEQKLL